ncbi:MAG: hypothetical protein ACFFDE_08925 [Promethearchaeota archaeon]
MKLVVSCPTCGTKGELEVPETTWERMESNIIMGRVPPGKVCEHGFKVEFSRSGLVLGYHDLNAEAKDFQIRPVSFTVQSAIRNLSIDVVAALLTAGISEETIVLMGSLAVTMGIREFMERVLPESVDVGSSIYMVTKEEYADLPESTKKHMTVDLSKKRIINSAFDDEQLEWVRRVLQRANMVTDQKASEDLILKETSKLRTTVSLLRHLATRRGAGIEGKKKANLE